MRTYGRVRNPDGTRSWRVVETDANGFDDLVWVTTLCQTLLLFLGESPFFADYGLPAANAIIQQIAPDFYVARTQRQFAPYFASLMISRDAANPPTYRVNVTTHQGVKLNASVQIPT